MYISLTFPLPVLLSRALYRFNAKNVTTATHHAARTAHRNIAMRFTLFVGLVIGYAAAIQNDTSHSTLNMIIMADWG